MSKSNVLGIGFALLVVGFVLGYASAPSPTAPAAAPAPSKPEPAVKPTQIFVDPEPRGPILEILVDAVKEPDAFARLTRLAGVLPALGPDLIPEIRTVLDDESLDPGGSGIELMVRWWALHDPVGASNWAFLKCGPGYKVMAVIAAVETWAEQDPEAAWRHIGTMSIAGSPVIDAAQIAMVRGWFKSGRPGLPEFIEKLGQGDIRQRAIAVFARKTIQRDGAEAIIRWADSVSGADEGFKLAVNRQVASEVALADPRAAVAWCERICDGPHGRKVRSLIAQRWADEDGRPAMEWAATAPVGEDESDWAVQGAFRGWFRGDREGLMEYVDEMGPDGVEPWFQPALEVLAVFVGGSRSPQEGFAWANAITAPVDRERTTVTIARNWRKKDPAAVDAWMDEVDLRDDLRERVLWEAPKRQGRSADEVREILAAQNAEKADEDANTEDEDGSEPQASE